MSIQKQTPFMMNTAPLSPEQQEEFADRFDKKENELIAYVNTL